MSAHPHFTSGRPFQQTQLEKTLTYKWPNATLGYLNKEVRSRGHIHGFTNNSHTTQAHYLFTFYSYFFVNNHWYSASVEYWSCLCISSAVLSNTSFHTLWWCSIIVSGSGLTMNPNPKWIRLTLDTPADLKSFDLPSESEPRFTVNPDPDPIIE